jgi:hypothetical protein
MNETENNIKKQKPQKNRKKKKTRKNQKRIKQNKGELKWETAQKAVQAAQKAAIG